MGPRPLAGLGERQNLNAKKPSNNTYFSCHNSVVAVQLFGRLMSERRQLMHMHGFSTIRTLHLAFMSYGLFSITRP